MDKDATHDIDRAGLMHRIILLSLLNELPGKPRENVISPEFNHSSSKHSLDFQQERTLVEAFAFLASTTEDPRKVVAVAVEAECVGKILVRLATNHGSLINNVTELKGLGSILMRSARQGFANSQEATKTLFRAVVSMHQNRILARLRSKHAVLRCNYKKERLLKPKTIPQLDSAIHPSDSKKTPLAPHSENDALIEMVDDLNRKFQKLENLSVKAARSRPGLKLLLDILDTCHRLHSKSALSRALNNASALAPDSKWKIMTTIATLSRYWTISKYLIRTSREVQQFNNFQIDAVQYTSAKQEKQAFSPSMNTSISRICSEERWSRFRSRKGIKSEADLRRLISKEIPLDPPVHAEIQLLWYYETTHCGAKPRTISSGKKACFLCNLFFHLHGGYFIPSTHGRLYTKWGLPQLSLTTPSKARLETAMHRLVTEVDDKLQEELKMPQKHAVYPNESAVFPSAACSYTNRSASIDSDPGGPNESLLDVDVKTLEATAEQEAPFQNLQDVPLVAETSGAARPLPCPSRIQLGSEQDQEQQIDLDSSAAGSSVSTLTANTFGRLKHKRLTLEAPVWIDMNAATPAFTISTSKLELTLVYDDGLGEMPTSSTVDKQASADRVLEYRVEARLFLGGEAPLDRGSSVADVDAMAPRSELKMDNEGGVWPWSIHVVRGDERILLIYHRGAAAS